MGNTEHVFSIGDEDLGRLLEAFRSAFPKEKSTQLTETVTYLDTLERDILAAGGALEAIPGPTGIELSWQHGDTILRSRASDRPQFARNLPAGPLREGLLALLAGRRLEPLVEVERRVEEFALRDDEDKTVARLRAVQRRTRAPGQRSKWHALPTLVLARSVRGYQHAFADLAGWVRSRSELEPIEPAELQEALEAVGRMTGPRVSSAEHSPTQLAPEAARAALRNELEQWTAQCEGVRADLDPEFLHRGRVALRRARCVLRELRRALPGTASRELLDELRWLGGESGPERDLDVLLEEFENLERSLPQDVHATLEALRAFVREEREAARARLLLALDGDRHGKLLAAWRALVDGGEPASAEVREPQAPILDLLSRRIRKRRGRLLDAGERLGLDPTPAALHELRIECKKLRYLLVSFRSLFPAELARPLQALEELQGALGRANDARVQSGLLHDLAERLHAAGRAPAACLIGTGRLLEELARRHARAAQDTLRLFRDFASRKEDLETLLLPSVKKR